MRFGLWAVVCELLFWVLEKNSWNISWNHSAPLLTILYGLGSLAANYLLIMVTEGPRAI